MRRKRSDPPAVAAALQRRPVVERVAPQLALVGEGVGRRAGDHAGAEQLRVRAVVGASPARRRSGRRRSAARRARPRRRAARPTRGRSGPGRRPRRAPAEARPVLDPVTPRARGSRSSSAFGDRRRGVGQQPRPGGERRRRLVRRAVAVRRPQRQHLPPRLARGGEPVDPAYASGPRRPPGSEVGCSWTPLEESTREVHRAAFVGYSRPRCPHPSAAQPPRRIRIQQPAPVVDCGRYAGQALVGDTVARLRRHLPRRPRDAPGRRALQRARAGAAGSRRRCTRIDAHVNGVRWAGEFPRRDARALAVHDRGVDRRLRDLARRAAAQDRRRPARTSRASSPRASCCSRTPPRAPRATRPRPIEAALDVLGRRRASRRGRRRARPRPAPPPMERARRAPRRAHARHAAADRGRPRRARASRPGTSCSRAPGAA